MIHRTNVYICDKHGQLGSKEIVEWGEYEFCGYCLGDFMRQHIVPIEENTLDYLVCTNCWLTFLAKDVDGNSCPNCGMP